MAGKLKRLSLWLLLRAPFINGVTLLMLLAERAPTDKNNPFLSTTHTYIHMAMCIACGGLMSLGIKPKAAALLHVGQLVSLGYSFWTNTILKHPDWIKTRSSIRVAGVASVFVLIAGMYQQRDLRDTDLRRVGRSLLSLVYSGLAASLVLMPKERANFSRYGAMGEVIMWATVAAYVVAAWYLTNSQNHRQGAMIGGMAILLMLLVDGQRKVWVVRHHLETWTWRRMILDDLVLLLATPLMAF